MDIFREGKAFHMEFRRGETVESLHVVGESDRTGTVVHFKPDSEVFSMTEYSFDTLSTRLRELSYLNPSLSVSLLDLRRRPLPAARQRRDLSGRVGRRGGARAPRPQRLLWRGLTMLRRRGVAWLDLGGIETTSAAGIAHFKLGLGGGATTLAGTYL